MKPACVASGWNESVPPWLWWSTVVQNEINLEDQDIMEKMLHKYFYIVDRFFVSLER